MIMSSFGVIIRTSVNSVNETSIQFTTTMDNNDWQPSLYHSITKCKDINGDSLNNNECEISTPNTWTPEPVDLVLSSLIPGKEYSVRVEEIRFRNGTDTGSEASTGPVTGTFCSG